MENIVEVKNLSYKYENQLALENVNLDVPKGSFLGLVGPNGSGKSTMLKCMLGVLPLQEGEIKLFGSDIKSFKDWSKVGYVSQKSNSFNAGFPASVFEVVASGLTPKMGLFTFLKKEHKEKVREALKAVDMVEFIHRNIGELSGGQQQRVFIARTLVADPELIILDEPTVGIDVKNVAAFYEMLEDLNKRLGITLIMVTHDIGSATNKFSHVACLNRRLFYHGARDDMGKIEDAEMSFWYGHQVQLLHHHHDEIDGGGCC